MGNGGTPPGIWHTIGTQSRNGQPASCPYLFDLNGGQGRSRTADTLIFSQVLYQLSYLAGCNLRYTGD
jgi:hypothetical protein